MVLQMELIMEIPFTFYYRRQIEPSRRCSQRLTFHTCQFLPDLENEMTVLLPLGSKGEGVVGLSSSFDPFHSFPE